MSRPLRLGICQLVTVANKLQNIGNAQKFIRDAADRGADLISLPEMFNCPYAKEYFRDYAENLEEGSHPTVDFLSSMARETGKWLIGGSIPEIDRRDRIFNTSLVFDNTGRLVAKHRKVHLFDIDVPGQYYKESETLTAGDEITVFDTPWCKVGVGICYDIRFPEQSLIMRQKGAEVLVFPASFNPTTGPLHFELLAKARALDNQCFVVLSAPARDLKQKGGYQTWGHSTVVNPNGLTIAQAELVEKLLIVPLDLADVQRQRTGFPFDLQRRNDIYQLKEILPQRL